MAPVFWRWFLSVNKSLIIYTEEYNDCIVLKLVQQKIFFIVGPVRWLDNMS